MKREKKLEVIKGLNNAIVEIDKVIVDVPTEYIAEVQWIGHWATNLIEMINNLVHCIEEDLENERTN